MKKLFILDICIVLVIIGILFSIKAPEKVNGLTVDNTTYNTVDLSWTKADNATGYYVYRTQNGDKFDYVGSTNETEFHDEALETGTTYAYIIKPHNGIKKAKSSDEVKATPNLDKPKVKVNTNKGKVELLINKVEGAQGYKILRNDKEIKVIEETGDAVFVDKTAKPDTNYSYAVKAYRKTAESDKSKEINTELVSAGDIKTKIRGDDMIISWGNDNYDNYKLYNGEDLLTETSDTTYTIPADLKEYDLKLTGYNDDTQSPETERKIEVVEEPMDNETAIQNAIDWAVDIAADDSFTYGKKPTTNKVGCYFCGTNQKKKPKGYEKTYVCMTFVTAAYAHGAKDPEVLDVCQKGKMCLSLTDTNFSKFSCWKKVGLCKNLSVSDLKPGDVIVWYDSTNGTDGHMSMYIGDGDICDASGGGWTPKSISVKPGAAQRYLNHRKNRQSSQNYVMRYTGNGGGTMKVIKDVQEKPKEHNNVAK